MRAVRCLLQTISEHGLKIFSDAQIGDHVVHFSLQLMFKTSTRLIDIYQGIDHPWYLTITERGPLHLLFIRWPDCFFTLEAHTKPGGSMRYRLILLALLCYSSNADVNFLYNDGVADRIVNQPGSALVSANGRWKLNLTLAGQLGMYDMTQTGASYIRWGPDVGKSFPVGAYNLTLQGGNALVMTPRRYTDGISRTLLDCNLVWNSPSSIIWASTDGLGITNCSASVTNDGRIQIQKTPSQNLLYQNNMLIFKVLHSGVEGGRAMITGNFSAGNYTSQIDNGPRNNINTSLPNQIAFDFPPITNQPTFFVNLRIVPPREMSTLLYTYDPISITNITADAFTVTLCVQNASPTLDLTLSQSSNDTSLQQWNTSLSPGVARNSFCGPLVMPTLSTPFATGDITVTLTSAGRTAASTFFWQKPEIIRQVSSVINDSSVVTQLNISISGIAHPIRVILNGSIIYEILKEEQLATAFDPIASTFSRSFPIDVLPNQNTLSFGLTLHYFDSFNTVLITSDIIKINVASLRLQNVIRNGTSAGDIYSVVDRAVLNALQNSSDYVAESADISVSAARLQNDTSVSLSFSQSDTKCVIPQDVLSEVIADGSGFAVLTRLSNNPFSPSNDNYTTVGNVVGLSVYNDDGQVLSVRDAKTPIQIVISADGLPSNRSTDVIVCLCNHLTNFTLGSSKLPTPLVHVDQRPDHTMYYLFSLLSIVIIAMVIIIVILIVRNRKKKSQVDFSLNNCTDVTCEGQIGRGSDSVVYAGSKGGTTAVAIKKSRDSKKILSEANRLKDLHHPNIVLYFGTYSEGAMTCLVTEYMDLHDAQSMLKNSSITLSFAASALLQISSAVAYLHDMSIVHGSICPKKILLSSDGHAKLSCVAATEEVAMYMMRYAAPEVVRKKGKTMASDVFSLGAVIRVFLLETQSNQAFRQERLLRTRENGLRWLTDAQRIDAQSLTRKMRVLVKSSPEVQFYEDEKRNQNYGVGNQSYGIIDVYKKSQHPDSNQEPIDYSDRYSLPRYQLRHRVRLDSGRIACFLIKQIVYSRSSDLNDYLLSRPTSYLYVVTSVAVISTEKIARTSPCQESPVRLSVEISGTLRSSPGHSTAALEGHSSSKSETEERGSFLIMFYNTTQISEAGGHHWREPSYFARVMEFGYNNIPPSQWKDWDLDGLDVGVASFNLILIPVLFVIFRRWEYKNGGVFRPVFYGLTAARIAHLISQILLREGVLIVPWWFYWFIATLPMMLFFTLFSTTLCSWGRVFISAEQQHSQRHSLSNRLTKVSRIMETVAYVVYFALTVLNLGLSVDQVTESSGDGEDYKPPIAAARSGTEKGILAFFVVLYVGVPLSFVIYMERFFMYSKLYKVNVFNKAYMTERSKPVVRRLSVVNLTLMFLFIMRAVILITNESSTNIRTTQWQGRLPFSIIFTLFLEILPTCLLLATATKRKSTKAQNKPLANAGRTSSFTSTIADLIRSEPSTPYMSSPVMVARSPKSYPSNSFASGITSTPPTRSPSSMGTVFSETSNLLPTRSIADLQNANDVNSIQRLSQYASINQCFHVERRSLFSAWIQYGAVKVVAISERVWTEPQQFHPRWEQEALLLLIRSYINSTQGQLWSDMANSHALEARRRPAHLPAVKNAPIPT
ncbi:serine/threonine protein kinase Cdc7, partial [Planoprotostelium fungivorum]